MRAAPLLPSRPISVCWLAVSLLLPMLAAQAQPALTVSPDTLRYPSEVEITLRNTGTAPLRIDSLSITPFTGYAWYFTLQNTGSSLGIILNSADHPTEPVGLDLKSGDEMIVRVDGYDPCIMCKAGTMADDLDIVDTLFIYTSDPAGLHATVLHKVYLDISTFVANEEVPKVSMVNVEVLPNPFVKDMRVRLEGTASSGWRLTVYNLLGRRVLVQEVREPGEHALSLPPGLAPGLYLLHVRDGKRLVAQRHLVKL